MCRYPRCSLRFRPENYRIYGPTAGSSPGFTSGIAWLTHVIPAGPVLVAPTKNALIYATDLFVKWKPVTKTIYGAPVDIIAYQLIIEKDAPPHPHMIGTPNSLSMYLPPTVTQITVPKGFLQIASAYSWEVLAIEKSGNQTLSSSAFRTR